MKKELLDQYMDLKKEIQETKERITKIERQLEKLEAEGTVKDVVSGGAGGIQHFCIEGIPYPEYAKKRSLLMARKLKLAQFEVEAAEVLSQIDNYLLSIDDSHVRRIISLRIIDGLSWNQVAQKMGGGNTEDCVKKTYYRYIKQTR